MNKRSKRCRVIFNNEGKRCIVIFFIIFLGFSFLCTRLYMIMNVYSEDLETNYNNPNSSKEIVKNINYDVVDCNSKSMLTFNRKYYAVVNPYTFTRNNSDTNKRELYALSYILKNYDNKYDLANIDIKNKSSKIYWSINETLYKDILKFKSVNGVYAYYVDEVNRDKASDICNILTNPMDKDNKKFKSNNSIEKAIYNEFKKYPFPEKNFVSDSNGNLISVNGDDTKDKSQVKLTIDTEINNKVQNILDGSNLKQVSAIVMQSDNGAIRAMAQKDKYAPNINLGGGGIYYPGSIFKAIVEEAAIETGNLDLNKPIKNTGKFSEDKIYDYCTPEQAFIISSNDVFINIGHLAGFDNIYEMSKRQGMFNKVLDFDLESSGRLDNNDSNSEGNLSLLSYGQSIRVTPIEAISIPNTIINRGIYVKPHIIDSYVINNTLKESPIYSSRVMKESTANIMKDQFQKVLTDKNGTGKLAYTNNKCIGGKTGTAQRINSNNNKSVDGWFVGFFDLKGINYSVVVFVPEINENSSGGMDAAPIFKQIVTELNK
ncbi:penicillin-binding transpeptidase domain-containing protein [Clostridium felsineum]|uniref:Peptidoglycan D,D-transpeptidase FtsI n=1 Tax=Clostridium felsineum TaxID=36839 RepID=A0A1S8L0N9_9CLOT|nr:penicillin-binding protein 2 [Clostridium felsineum]MCR3759263.1 penicillin-binding protein 2 [Clostridium felsineum]URZ00847.1 Peptidoglycan D,D-transpeptidase FtsI [Clostridium felsineum]URZ06406.1 Peptidoglycan D,D-transpeptidase FtsI [Clostridium felsineum]URZ11441.1 Peptidoglycan D,D-transpeptidase FtsI [Clostridium felsineum]